MSLLSLAIGVAQQHLNWNFTLYAVHGDDGLGNNIKAHHKRSIDPDAEEASLLVGGDDCGKSDERHHEDTKNRAGGGSNDFLNAIVGDQRTYARDTGGTYYWRSLLLCSLVVPASTGGRIAR